MKTETKTFDVGIYTFRRKFFGPKCPKDDQATPNGTVFAVLHPLTKVDPMGIYCFGVSGEDLNTKTLVRKNLHLSKVISLKYPPDGLEIHAKLNACVDFLRQGRQISILEVNQ